MSLGSNTFTTQAGTVYLKRAGTFDRFEWGGRVMRIDASTNNLGGLSVTTRQNPRGGIERDRVNQDIPGTVDFALVMKEQQRSRKSSELLKCYFHVDRRIHCQGRDRDDPFAWEQITRKCFAKATSRETPQSTWEGEEDAMVTISFQALDEFDIYPVTFEDVTFGAGT